MLAPIAHAYSASSQQKGFLASLCLGNKIVFVELSLPTEQASHPSAEPNSNHCPLCSIVEQQLPNQMVTSGNFVLPKKRQQFVLTNVVSTDDAIPLSAIRAPPLHA